MTYENMEVLRLSDSRSNRNDSTSSTETDASEADDTLLYHMQKKYLEEPEVDSFINFVRLLSCYFLLFSSFSLEPVHANSHVNDI